MELTERIASSTPASDTLTLTFDQRQKSRFRTRTDQGQEIGVILPRGTILRGGDRLASSDGFVVEVRAAAEDVSTVHSHHPLELVRAAYHLGNRHVQLQIGDHWIRYLADHVLDEMLVGMGVPVHRESAPFEPEAGAYSHGGHHHGHGGHHHAHE